MMDRMHAIEQHLHDLFCVCISLTLFDRLLLLFDRLNSAWCDVFSIYCFFSEHVSTVSTGCEEQRSLDNTGSRQIFRLGLLCNQVYLWTCVCMCACVCVRACVRVCLPTHLYARANACVHAAVRRQVMPCILVATFATTTLLRTWNRRAIYYCLKPADPLQHRITSHRLRTSCLCMAHAWAWRREHLGRTRLIRGDMNDEATLERDSPFFHSNECCAQTDVHQWGLLWVQSNKWGRQDTGQAKKEARQLLLFTRERDRNALTNKSLRIPWFVGHTHTHTRDIATFVFNWF